MMEADIRRIEATWYQKYTMTFSRLRLPPPSFPSESRLLKADAAASRRQEKGRVSPNRKSGWRMSAGAPKERSLALARRHRGTVRWTAS
jgi:hypothetical protein